MTRFFPEKKSKNWLFFFFTISIISIFVIVIRLYITNGYSLNIVLTSIPYILSYAIIPALIICISGYYAFTSVSIFTLIGFAVGLFVFLYSAISPGEYRTFEDLAGVAWFISLVVLGFVIGLFIEILLFIYRKLRRKA
jgi:hypothetical protein